MIRSLVEAEGRRVEGGGLNKKQGQAQRISEEIWDFCDSYNASHQTGETRVDLLY